MHFKSPSCPYCTYSHPRQAGSFFRKSDSKTVKRWRCPACEKTFSQASFHPCYGQNKRHLNDQVKKLLLSGVSQRRIAKILHIHPITVARKLKFLAFESRKLHKLYLKDTLVSEIQFDEMESFEHTKLKPLSIALAVSSDRKILGIKVKPIKAKGHLAEISFKKYGIRTDKRVEGLKELLFEVSPLLKKKGGVFKSDESPIYPRVIEPFLKKRRFKQMVRNSRYDPLFSINHTCAMVRDNLKRMSRKTWCTTKKMSALYDHLTLYMTYHNEVLTA